MKAIEKLQIAKELLEKQLKSKILGITLNINLERLKIILMDGTSIFIQYNNYNEYSYSVIFSNLNLDRFRFDNYDFNWEVDSKPNHYYPQKEKIGKNSPMTRNPQMDMPILSEIILLGRF